MADRNTRSELAMKIGEMRLLWITGHASGRFDEATEAQMWELLCEVYVLVEVYEVADRFGRQLERIPLSAPNRTVMDQLRDLQRIIGEYLAERNRLNPGSVEAA